jgi:hypothetical protein
MLKQGRLADAAQLLATPLAERPPLHVARERAERQVRCLLRLSQLDQARQVAERAKGELGLPLLVLMVDLAEGKLAAVREQLDDLQVRKALALEAIDQDPELVGLLLNPELADARNRLTLPLGSYATEPDHAIVVLLAQPLDFTSAQLAVRLANIGVEGVQVWEAAGGEADGRRSFRVVQGQEAVIVTFGSGPYWEPGGYRRLPQDASLAQCLAEHRGFVVLARDRGPESRQDGAYTALERTLAAELASEGGLAVHAQPPRSTDARLVAVDEALLAELKRGEFLTDRPRAGSEFQLFDRLRYPDNPAAEKETDDVIVRRRAARQLARKIGGGERPSGQVRVVMWRGHAREFHWLSIQGASRDEYGRWQLIGELTADSTLRPALTKGTRLIVEPNEVLEIRE